MTRRVQVLLLLVSFAALIVAVVVGWQRQADADRLQDYINCQVGVNEATALAQRERGAAAQVDRDADRTESAATKTLIVAVFAAAGPDQREQIRRAFTAYEQTMRAVDASRADAERQRREHPLPPLPSETCRR